jgi:hypothetical protein
VTAESTFYEGETPRPFLRLRCRRDGDLHVIEDPGLLECQLTSGLYAGLQNSVIRRQVFDSDRFWTDYRVVEDVLFLVRALSRGLTIAYFPGVHVVYRVHDDNSSASASGADPSRLLPIFEEHVRGLERLEHEAALSPRERAVLNRTIANIQFWRLGYLAYRPLGRRADALGAFRAAIARRPADWRMWKTLLASVLRLDRMYGSTARHQAAN